MGSAFFVEGGASALRAQVSWCTAAQKKKKSPEKEEGRRSFSSYLGFRSLRRRAGAESAQAWLWRTPWGAQANLGRFQYNVQSLLGTMPGLHSGY